RPWPENRRRTFPLSGSVEIATSWKAPLGNARIVAQPGLRPRQAHLERRPAPLPVEGADRAAVQQDEMLRDGQSEADARHRPRTAFGHAIEAVEDAVERVRRRG